MGCTQSRPCSCSLDGVTLSQTETKIYEGEHQSLLSRINFDKLQCEISIATSLSVTQFMKHLSQLIPIKALDEHDIETFVELFAKDDRVECRKILTAVLLVNNDLKDQQKVRKLYRLYSKGTLVMDQDYINEMVEDIFDVSLRCTPFLAKSDDIPLEFINDYLKKLESAEEIVAQIVKIVDYDLFEITSDEVAFDWFKRTNLRRKLLLPAAARSLLRKTLKEESDDEQQPDIASEESN